MLASVLTVRATTACPLASVMEKDVANDPPVAPPGQAARLHVLVHTTVFPAIATGLFEASASCAVTSTVDPADAVAGPLTMYFVAPLTTMTVLLFVPAVWPSVHDVSVATPEPFVATVATDAGLITPPAPPVA